MSYEDYLIREMTLDQTEATTDWFDHERGLEAEPYTYEEAQARRNELCE